MKLHLLLSLFTLFAFNIQAQQISFEFDYAQFGFDSTSNYVEFYYSFNQASLTLYETDSSRYVQGTLAITITDSLTGEVFLDKTWSVENPVTDSINVDRSLIGILCFILDEGSYKCIITGADAVNPSISKTISELIRVKPFLDNEIALSDVQLASKIVQDSQNEESIFYKNTFEVTPNPTAVFGEGQPVLFYYTELYNLPQVTVEAGLRFDQLLFNSRGQLVLSKRKDLKRTVDSRVEVGRVVANKLPTDTYTLTINLVDSVTNVGVSSSKRFFVYNPSIAYVDTFQQNVSPVLSTQFGAMSEEELDDLYYKSEYIASNLEQDRYDALKTIDGKREFLYNFWKARDENPSDDYNHSYITYLKRLEDCNLKFRAMSKEGWKTDRGRIYLTYGEPSEIERYPNQIETRPYEIWSYHNLEGGVYFIFADLFGFSDYQLVHSSKRGELRDESWQRRITIQ
jgi:GWxTD domain-containing protein